MPLGQSQAALKRTLPKRTFKAFIGHAPVVTIIKSSVYKNRIRACQGMGELRARRRTKADKRDPIEFRHVPLPRSVITQIAADLKIKHAYDKPITQKQWDKVLDEVIASIVVEAVIRK